MFEKGAKVRALLDIGNGKHEWSVGKVAGPCHLGVVPCFFPDVGAFGMGVLMDRDSLTAVTGKKAHRNKARGCGGCAKAFGGLTKCEALAMIEVEVAALEVEELMR